MEKDQAEQVLAELMPQMQDLPILGSMTLADSGKLLFAGSSKVEDATADKNAKNSKNGAGGAAVVVTAESVMETAQAKIDDLLKKAAEAEHTEHESLDI